MTEEKIKLTKEEFESMYEIADESNIDEIKGEPEKVTENTPDELSDGDWFTITEEPVKETDTQW